MPYLETGELMLDGGSILYEINNHTTIISQCCTISSLLIQGQPTLMVQFSSKLLHHY